MGWIVPGIVIYLCRQEVSEILKMYAMLFCSATAVHMKWMELVSSIGPVRKTKRHRVLDFSDTT